MSQSNIAQDRSTQRPGAMRRLADWGIVELVDDYRAARFEQVSITQVVTHHKVRASFSSECIDCGQAPHVCVDDHSVAVCLRCGRDKWL